MSTAWPPGEPHSQYGGQFGAQHHAWWAQSQQQPGAQEEEQQPAPPGQEPEYSQGYQPDQAPPGPPQTAYPGYASGPAAGAPPHAGPYPYPPSGQPAPEPAWQQQQHQQGAYHQWHQGYQAPHQQQPAPQSFDPASPSYMHPPAAHYGAPSDHVPAQTGNHTPPPAWAQPQRQSGPASHQGPQGFRPAEVLPGPPPQVTVTPSLAAQQGRSPAARSRPLAQPSAQVPFTIRPKMPRKGASGPAQRPQASATAFVPVPAQPAPAPKKPDAWPASLRDFVTRALKPVIGHTAAYNEMQAALKQLIGAADKLGQRWSKDWDTEPVPTLPGVTAALGPALAPGAPALPAAGTPPPPPKHGVAHYPASVPTPPNSKAAKRMRKAAYKAEREARAFQRRRLDGEGRSSSDSPPPRTEAEEAAEQARRARFGNGSVQGGRTLTATVRQQRAARIAAVHEAGFAEDQVWDDFVIRGTSRGLEKSYFRLAAPPDPKDVRPEAVLWQALNRLTGLLAAGQVKYLYAMDQFKGMRQDLTVQHLGGQLAVQVYESAARAALEYGDLPEYNQCQAKLGGLHAQAGLKGCREEFLAYRILYQVAHSGQAGGAAALLSTLRLVSGQVAQHPAVAHAMEVRRAAGLGNATQLCALYAAAPNLGRALLDLLLPKARFKAAQVLAKAWAQSKVPVSCLARLLGFWSAVRPGGEGQPARPLPGCTAAVLPGRYALSGTEAEGVDVCQRWLLAHQAVLVPPPSGPGELLMDCKASKGQLAVPEDTAAVAHGDAGLKVDDFLKSVLK